MERREVIEAQGFYGEYAAVYDHTGQIRFSILMAQYLRDIIARHPPPGRRMIDLACGTGTLALMQVELGYEVLGIDASPAMLEQARQKAAAARVGLELMQADMRTFVVREPVDLVTCFYDTLNYLLTEAELLACFRAIRAALVPGGMCYFDMATEYFLREYWRGVEEYTSDDYRHTMTSSFDEITGHSKLVLIGTKSAVDGSTTSFTETHVERAFSPERVRQLLAVAELRVEQCYDCFTYQAPNAASLRHFWVVRRP